MRPAKHADGRRERGAVMVFAALAATALLLFAALTIDVGLVWSSRTQSQSAGDAAALAAAAKMINSSGGVALDEARAEAIDYAKKHSTVANPEVTLRDDDITFGNWNLCDPGLDTSVDTGDPDQVTAVRVDVKMDGAADGNKASPVFLSQLLGLGAFNVKSSSVAYLGFEGSAPAGDFTLPLAINGCALSGPCCFESDFCETIASPLSPSLSPCLGDPTLSCLSPLLADPLASLACWTGFDGLVSSISPLQLLDLINNGNPGPLHVGDLINLQGGSVDVIVLDRVKSKLDAAGGTLVVKLPVVACQPGRNACASGFLPLSGSVCFEITDVIAPPLVPLVPLIQEIRGRFLCPSDAKFAECEDPNDPPRETGGCNYGFRADRAVLVN